MALVASPYGLRLTNMQGGQYATHGMRLIKITAGYATNIFFGDLVTIVAGCVEKDSGTTTALPIGVFMGVEYEDPAYGLNFRQYWPASTVIKTGTTAWAYVLDDPDALFEAQANGALAQAAIGQNVALVQGAGNVAIGRSGVSLNAGSLATTATLPIRIVDFQRRPGSTIGDAYTDVIVRINTHLNRSNTGKT